MNKRGFLRILEAVIAVVLLLGFIFFITIKSPEVDVGTPVNIKDSMVYVIDQIINENSLRKCMLESDIKGICGTDLSFCECDTLFSLKDGKG